MRDWLWLLDAAADDAFADLTPRPAASPETAPTRPW